jgi:hypothetical protein
MTPMKCPNGCDLTGNPIPEEHRSYYQEGATNFSRVIGNYDWYEDRTITWSCPDCGVVWTRLSSEKEPEFLQPIATKFSKE